MDRLLRRAGVIGLLGGAAGVHVSLVGMVAAFQTRDLIAEIITVGTMLPLAFAIVVGWVASRPRPSNPDATPSGTLLLGAVAGAAAGIVLALLCLFVVAVDVRWILSNARPQLAETLQFGQGPVIGSLIIVGGSALLGTAGAALHVVPSLIGRALTIVAV